MTETPEVTDPEVVCLCGSTRFKRTYREENQRLTMEGKIVLTVGLFGHADDIDLSDDENRMLASLHKRKIDKADRIHVINPAGYVGDSTRREIKHARETNTDVTWYNDDGRPLGWPRQYSAAGRTAFCPHQMMWDDSERRYQCLHDCGEVDETPPPSKIEDAEPPKAHNPDKWTFSEDDVIRQTESMMAPGGVSMGKGEYRIKRLLRDPDDGERYYHVEGEEGGTHLYAVGAIEAGRYEKISPSESRAFEGE